LSSRVSISQDNCFIFCGFPNFKASVCIGIENFVAKDLIAVSMPQADSIPMLSTTTRLKLQDILTRLSRNELVSLEERILIQKYADRNSTVWQWLRKARSIQARGHLDQQSVGGFMQQMNLPGQTSEDHFNGSQDDLGEWFQGSPQWVRRS